MKKNFHQLIFAVLMCLIIVPASAQVTTKEAKKALKLRPPKEVRKQAKEYTKDGYYVAVGAPTIERQLTTAWMREVETDDNGFPRLIPGYGSAVGETQIAAKLQATEAAKLELAGSIASNVAALIENNFANAQLNTQEASSVTQTVAASKNIIAQEIGRTIPLVELYKNMGNNIEANIRIAYSSEMAMEMAKKVVREQLEDKANILQDKLDKLMKF